MLTKKTHLDIVRKLEAFLMNEQKVHEVEELEIVDGKEIEAGSIGKESTELELPGEDKITVSPVSFEGIKPQRFIKIHAKKIINNTTPGKEVMKFKYDPKTKTIIKI